MKRMSFIFSCLVYLGLFQTVFAQDASQSYSKFRVLLKTGDRIEIEQGRLTATGLINFVNANDQKEIPFSDMRAIDRRVGSKALLYGGIGLGIGLVGSLLGIAQVQADPTKKLKDNAGGIVAGITAAFGLIGFIVGSGYDDWEKVPLNATVNTDYNRGGYQLSLRINF